jgi:hypothetical protein
MNKIPTVFVRDPQNMRNVLPEVNPGCEWVLSGEGIATRKYDGTCVMFDGTAWYARREVRPGKQTPAVFMPVETDEITGKVVGWEPVEQSGYFKWFSDALRHGDSDTAYPAGTYELCGPKVQGNPEGFERHVLVPHTHAEVVIEPTIGPRSFESIKEQVLVYGSEGREGFVYHHPDGRMAKIKARDFR